MYAFSSLNEGIINKVRLTLIKIVDTTVIEIKAVRITITSSIRIVAGRTAVADQRTRAYGDRPTLYCVVLVQFSTSKGAACNKYKKYLKTKQNEMNIMLVVAL